MKPTYAGPGTWPGVSGVNPIDESTKSLADAADAPSTESNEVPKMNDAVVSMSSRCTKLRSSTLSSPTARVLKLSDASSSKLGTNRPSSQGMMSRFLRRTLGSSYKNSFAGLADVEYEIAVPDM